MTDATTQQPLIELKHVDKHFGSLHVLRDINLSIAPGEVVVVIGPSGSGKSTLCRAINRLETIDSGEILIDGEPLPQEGRELAAVRAELGMVFQQFNLFSHMTVLENVMLAPTDVLGLSREEARTRAMDLLERVGVAEQAEKVPAQISGGQQQRVAIARALAMHPRAMLFDEPTSALDPEMIDEVLEVMIGHSTPGYDHGGSDARDELRTPRCRPRGLYGRRRHRRRRRARCILRSPANATRSRFPRQHQKSLTLRAQRDVRCHCCACTAPQRHRDK